MKRIFFLLFLSISISVEAQTSVYHPFPDSNAVWNVDFTMWWGCGPPMYTNKHELYSYILNGDTAVGIHQYHQVYVTFVQENCTGTGTSHHQTSGYKGCIRQDTALKKVYFIYPNDSVDSLLYDFTLQVGDTIKGILSNATWMCGAANFPLMIDSIDSVFVYNDYRKRWNFSGPLGSSIVEGIGCVNGLLEIICEFPDAPYSLLSCFKQNGLTLYPDSTTDCNLIDGIINVSGENISHFSLFPNPVHDFINITNNQAKELSITIFSSIGEVVSRTSLMKDAAATINLSALAAGIYLVTAKSDKSFAVQKLVKQ